MRIDDKRLEAIVNTASVPEAQREAYARVVWGDDIVLDLCEDLLAARRGNALYQRDWSKLIGKLDALDPEHGAGMGMEYDHFLALRRIGAEIERLEGFKAEYDELCDQHRRTMDEPCSIGFPDERHCACVPELKRVAQEWKERAEKAEALGVRAEKTYQILTDQVHDQQVRIGSLEDERVALKIMVENAGYRETADAIALLLKDRKRGRLLVRAIFEAREFNPCWYPDDEGDTGDCGNWPTCQPECPLRKLADLVGIEPQEDGETWEAK